MISVKNHPTPAQFMSYLQDRLDEAESKELVAHVESCSFCANLMEELSNTGADDLMSGLRLLGDSQVAQPGDDADEHRQPTPKRQPFDERYVRGELLGRGGMGEVVLGYDKVLQRELVLKMVRPEKQACPETARRFKVEAAICSQLQHPSIIPVYDHGEFGDGRSFIAMKLVRGRTLRELLSQQEVEREGLRRLLVVFSHVCNAMAYAHERGVIHRDLKPENVMVGAFDEVQVMDWGLAKQLAEAEETFPREPIAATTSFDFETQAGAVVGTPGYMAPEQARGDRATVDERGDVYALGGILHEILTGTRPKDAATESAESGESDGKRSWKGDSLAELLELARDCLAQQPESRPRNAAEVELRLQEYFDSSESRLRTAELQRATAETRALLAIAVCLLLIVSCVGAVMWGREMTAKRERENAELWQAIHRVEDTMARAREAEPFLTQNDLLVWNEAEAAVERARSLTTTASSALAATELDSLANEVANSSSAARAAVELHLKQQAAQQLFDKANRRRTRLMPESSHLAVNDVAAIEDHRKGLQQLDVEVGVTPVGEAVDRVRSFPKPFQRDVVDAVDAWLEVAWFNRDKRTEPNKQWLLTFVAELDDDDSRQQIRKLIWKGNHKRLRELSRLEGVERSAQTSGLLARALDALRDHKASIRLLRRAHAVHPQDFWINWMLAHASPLDSEEALRYFTACAAILPDNAGVQLNIGIGLKRRKRSREGYLHLKRVIELQDDYPEGHESMGQHWGEVGEYEKAIAAYRRAIELKPNFFEYHVRVSGFLLDSRQFEAAIKEAQYAFSLEPEDHRTHAVIARARYELGDEAGAFASAQRALELYPYSSRALEIAGIVNAKRGNFEQAAIHYELLVERFPEGTVKARRNLVLIYRELKLYEKACETCKSMLEVYPNEWPALMQLAQIRHEMGDGDQVEAELNELIRDREPIWKAIVQCVRGQTLVDLKRFDEGIALLKAGEQAGAGKLPIWTPSLAVWIERAERRQRKHEAKQRNNEQ